MTRTSSLSSGEGYYYSYMCSVCERLFRLIDPDDGYTMGGIIIRLPSKDLFKRLSEVEDISEGVCRKCIQNMYMRKDCSI